jgi:hypothetical protein
MAVRRADEGWPPDDARWLVLTTHAVIFPAVGRVTVSLGLAAYPEAVESVTGLLEPAEQALLVGRRSGDAEVAAPARRDDEPPAGRW